MCVRQLLCGALHAQHTQCPADTTRARSRPGTWCLCCKMNNVWPVWRHEATAACSGAAVSLSGSCWM